LSVEKQTTSASEGAGRLVALSVDGDVQEAEATGDGRSQLGALFANVALCKLVRRQFYSARVRTHRRDALEDGAVGEARSFLSVPFVVAFSPLLDDVRGSRLANHCTCLCTRYSGYPQGIMPAVT
jgi:hypothetical protein